MNLNKLIFDCDTMHKKAGLSMSSNLLMNLALYPKLFHYYIRSKKKRRMFVGPLKLPNGQLNFDPERLANDLADTFVSVFLWVVFQLLLQYQTYDGVMPDVVITVNRVKDVLHDLNVNSAVGPDNVHPRLLRACAHELSVPLTMIFNKSLEEGALPSVWLESIIVPLFKA